MAELNVTESAEKTPPRKPEEPDNANPTATDLYGNMKIMSQSMLDMALLLSNVSELVQVLKIGKQQEFYVIIAGLLCTSIILQILVGVALLLVATSGDGGKSVFTKSAEQQKKEVGLMNRLVMVGVFLITVINIFISAFSFKQSSDIQTDGNVISYRKDGFLFPSPTKQYGPIAVNNGNFTRNYTTP